MLFTLLQITGKCTFTDFNWQCPLTHCRHRDPKKIQRLSISKGEAFSLYPCILSMCWHHLLPHNTTICLQYIFDWKSTEKQQQKNSVMGWQNHPKGGLASKALRQRLPFQNQKGFDGIKKNNTEQVMYPDDNHYLGFTMQVGMNRRLGREAHQLRKFLNHFWIEFTKANAGNSSIL